MAILGVDDFKSKLRGGGARPNLFKVTINFPGFAEGDAELTSFLCEAASLPGSTFGIIQVPFRGRILKMAGDRTFAEWTTTIINDTDFAVRKKLEDWMNTINNLNTNVSVGGSAAGNITSYMGQMTVRQLGRGAEDEVLKSYTLLNCWPTTIAPIELNWDTRNEVETFDVTWRYTEFQIN